MLNDSQADRSQPWLPTCSGAHYSTRTVSDSAAAIPGSLSPTTSLVHRSRMAGTMSADTQAVVPAADEGPDGVDEVLDRSEGVSATAVIVVVLIVVVVALAVIGGGLYLRHKRSERLREEFGSEYEREVAGAPSRTAADERAAGRQKRHCTLEGLPW